jgi:hypothetical protein
VSGDPAPRKNSISGAFHPLVYKLMAGLAAWFVLMAWTFAGGGATDLALMLVTFIFLVGVGIPSLIGRIRRAHRNERPDDDESTVGPDRVFGNWAGDEVELRTGPVKGKFAAIDAILPIAAAAFSMTAFALVLHFTVG